MESIEFECIIHGLRMSVDNGIIASFELGENNIEQFAMLAACKQEGAVLKAILTPIEVKPVYEGKGTKPISRRKAKRRVG